MQSLPATPYSPHVLPSETGSLSCTAAKTVKKQEALSFKMLLHTLTAQANFPLIHILFFSLYSIKNTTFVELHANKIDCISLMLLTQIILQILV